MIFNFIMYMCGAFFRRYGKTGGYLMHCSIRGMLAALALLLLVTPLSAKAEELTGTDVITKMRMRPDGEDRKGTVSMTLVNRRGAKRVRVMEQVAKDYGMDRKAIIVFNEPADVRGTRFLSWTYDEPGRDDDKWLYIPSMKKVRRISGAANNDFFMGSDFTYDDIDMGRRNISKDTHTYLGEESRGSYECWKVESVPVDKDDPVRRRVLWVDKKTCIPVYLEYYTDKGLSRVYEVLELQKQQGFWNVKSSRMRNLETEHQTLMEFGPFVYDRGVDDNLFQVAVLQRG